MKELLACIFFLPSLAFSQPGFQKYFSEPIEYQQFGYSEYDSSFILAGNRFVSGTVYDFCAAKIDRNGNLLWSQSYPSANDEFLSSLAITASGEIILGGYKSNSAGDNDYSLVKTDASGNLLWHRMYGTSHMEMLLFSGEDGNGNILMAGNRESGNEPAAWKIDPAGNLLWNKTYGSTAGTELAEAAAFTGDGGIVMAGNLYGTNEFLQKVSASGNTAWAYSYSSQHAQFISSVRQTKDKGYIQAGTDYRCDSFGCFPFFSFVRFDSSGNVLWAKAVEGFFGWGRNAMETSDGGFVFTGQLQDTGTGNKNSALLRTDGNGNFQWAMTYGKSGMAGESFFAEELPGGGFTLFGLVNSGAHLIRTDAFGSSGCWESSISPILSSMSFLKTGTTSLAEVADPLTTLAPSMTASPFPISDSLFCTVLGAQETTLPDEVTIFPNPFSESALVKLGSQRTFHLFLSDVLGRRVLTYSCSDVPYFRIERGTLARGVYTLQISTGNSNWYRKVVIE